MFGKTKTKKQTEKHTETQYHHHHQKKKKKVYKLQQRVEKSLLDPCNIFLEPRRSQKGPWTQLTGHFFVSQIFE